MALLSGCGSSLYQSAPADYQEVFSVPGVTFAVPNFILQTATAITDITDDGNYDREETYLYKNGVDRYTMFNMDSAVVIVQRGSQFHIQEADDKKSCVKNGGMEGIYFSSIDALNGDGKKIVADINNAQVSITQDLYGDYAGKLAILSADGEEWSLFVGIPAERLEDLGKDQKKVVNAVSGSFTLTGEVVEALTEESEEAEESEAVEDIQKDKTEDVQPTEEAVPEEMKEELTAENSGKNVEAEQVEASVHEIETEAPAPDLDENGADVEIKQETEQVEPVKVEEAEKMEPVQTEETEPELPVSIKDVKEEKVADTVAPVSTLESKSNQKANGSKKEPSYSTIYAMLSLGDIGVYSTSNEFGQLEHLCILDSVVTGKEAETIIREYCKSPGAAYEYPDPPSGCSWHLLKYQTNADPGQYYTDVKLCGLDGGKLNYRGVSYTPRTHDIHYFMKKDKAFYKDLYCFYAVPNGCKEYMLRVGDQNPDDPEAPYTACYYIKL